MINIAIDGFAGSGKGTLAEGLAKNFNLKHLDTGAILRSMGLYFENLGITEPTNQDLETHINNIDIKIEFIEGKQHTYLGKIDVSSEIRQENIGQMASKIAVFKDAMLKLIRVSQDFASKNDCVLDGRNITSEVLPNADVKFFLDASLDCRAKRRLMENIAKNKNITFEEVKKSLQERDIRDCNRKFSPMILVEDAIKIDTSNMNIDEVVEYCSEIVRQKLQKLHKLF